jgi:hypothetical protein
MYGMLMFSNLPEYQENMNKNVFGARNTVFAVPAATRHSSQLTDTVTRRAGKQKLITDK